MPRLRTSVASLAGASVVALLGCATAGSADNGSPSAPSTTSRAPEPATTSASPSPDGASATRDPATPAAKPAPPKTRPRTETAWLSIPEIGLKNLRVLPYKGTTDDWPGTRIQNGGIGASPYGKRGGVGPGEIGNFLVTAHRLSAGGPLRELPTLDEGDSVLVRSGGKLHEYEISDSRETSFRSERSLAEQRADVPGIPGEAPTQAMITISTCATPEDDAAGNTWRDDRGNPEQRLDKIGVLTSTR